MHRPLAAALFAVALGLAAAPALAQSTYDEGWHRATFWSGEYPNGFTVLKDTTVELRPTLDPAAEKTIACDLRARATYQVWNAARVEAQGLSFVSYTRIADYKIKSAHEATLYRTDDASEVTVSFKPGDVWRYLVYYAEGNFGLEYDGVRYDGDQSLFDVSEQIGDTNGYEEWLRINCPNNQWGWLYMGDIQLDDAAFTGANVPEYGTAKDLD